MKSKRAQLTIFVIVGIVIVGAILAILFYFGRVSFQSPDKANPKAYIEECVKKVVEPSIKKIYANGGLIDPKLQIMYMSENYTYLCYQNNNYLSCINQIPLLKTRIESEIKKDTEGGINNCFNSLRMDLEDQHFVVRGEELDYSVTLAPKTIFLKINKPMQISKEQASNSYEDFNVRIQNPLYELSGIAAEIANQESQYCNFEYNGYMLLYPQYDIKRISYIDSRIYIVGDRDSGKEFKFAVRSCAFPPGF